VARTLLLRVTAVFGGAQRANNRELLLLLKGEPHPGGSIMVKNPESVLGKGTIMLESRHCPLICDHLPIARILQDEAQFKASLTHDELTRLTNVPCRGISIRTARVSAVHWACCPAIQSRCPSERRRPPRFSHGVTGECQIREHRV